MCKLLIVIPHMLIGGAQRLLSELTPLMARRDDLDITFAVYSDPGNSAMWKPIRSNPRIHTRILNIPSTIRANRNPFIRAKAIKALRPLLEQAEICHAHLFPALYDAAIASRGLSTRLLFTEHSTFNLRRPHPIFRFVERRIYDLYSDIICISPACARSLSDWLNLHPTDPRIHIVRNGINPKRFNFSDKPNQDDISQSLPENASDLMEQYEIFCNEKDMFREERMSKAGIKKCSDVYQREGHPILMASRFVNNKDQHSLIKALAILKNDSRLSNIIPKDTFIAFAGDGPTRKSAERLAVESGIGNDVLFLGDRDDIPRLIAAASIGAQISNWEGFGLTACEMLAAGLPLISSKVAGMTDTVKGGARLVAPASPEEIANAIVEILSPESPDIFNSTLMMRAEGFRISERHDIRYTLNDYLDIYNLTTT